MANRIDVDDFTGFRNIPNRDKDYVEELLQSSIDRLEPRFFIEVFGYEFQKLMLANPTNPIYEPILEGVEFTNSDGKLQNWEGINESIANYIYYYHVKENWNTLSSTGVIAGSNENSDKISGYTKINTAYNFIYPALCILDEFLTVNIANYPTLEFENKPKLNSFGI